MRRNATNTIFVKSEDGRAIFKVHKSIHVIDMQNFYLILWMFSTESILTPISGAEKVMTRNLTLQKNGTVFVQVKWGQISAEPGLILGVKNYNTNETFKGTKLFSQLKLELAAGEYQLSITNFTDGYIEHINFKTNGGKKFEVNIFSRKF